MPRRPPYHVQVDLTGRFGGQSEPGILIAWRKNPRRGWEAWVVRASSYSTGDGAEVDLRFGWVPAHLVRPD